MSEEQVEKQEETADKPQVPDTQEEGKVEGQEQQPAEVKEKVEELKPEEMTEEQIDESDAPDSLKTALKREKRRLRKERQQRAQLEQRLQEVESRIKQVDSQKEADSVLKEIEDDLGLDGENSKKFYTAVDKIVARKLTGLQPQAQQVSSQNLTPRQQQFVEKINEARRSYSEAEWSEMSPYMHQVMQNEMKSLGNMGLDPEDVYEESVHSYFAKAVKQKALQDAHGDRNKKINEDNARNLAGSESSVDSSGKPVGNQKITQEVFEKNRSNPDWIKKNKQKIIDAATQGLIRGR